MGNITFFQLLDLCEKHRYLLLRKKNGKLVGLNCGVSRLARKRFCTKMDYETNFVSFQSVTINEYINYKAPFVLA